MLVVLVAVQAWIKGAGECGHGMCEGVFGVVRDLVSLGEAQVVQTGYAGSIPVATPAS